MLYFSTMSERYKDTPIEDPKIALAVLVENGGGGSKVAAPVARKILDYYLKRKNPVMTQASYASGFR